MISERVLRQIAAKTGVGVGQSEHEYVLLCVLDSLGQTSPLADTFCLKGGTALRLVHFDDWWKKAWGKTRATGRWPTRCQRSILSQNRRETLGRWGVGAEEGVGILKDEGGGMKAECLSCAL